MEEASLPITRRTFVARAAAIAGVLTVPGAASASTSPFRDIPIIDAHIHLFDPTRPQGAPYSGPRVPGQAPIPAYPDRYRAVAAPFGSVGAIKVEASPWIEDNLWVLEVAQRDPIMVGVIGNLQPDKPEYPEYLDRFSRNPLFLGIRYGSLWGRNLPAQVDNPAFIQGLELLADADLVFETANPSMSLLEAALRISDRVPRMRIVLDHLPHFVPSEAERPRYDALLEEFSGRPQVYAKLTEILRRVDGEVSTELSSYRATLDQLVAAFGEDRIIFGSDWPNSDGFASLDHVFRIAREYFDTKPTPVAEKFFWRNSLAAYRWIRRDSTQPNA